MRFLPLFVFWCLWFLNFTARLSFAPLLPLIEDTLSLTHGAAGSFFTSLSIGFSLSMLLAGRFASSWGYKRTVVGVFLGIWIASLFVQVAETYFAFHLIFFFVGFATGGYIPSMIPIITGTYEPRYWGKVLGSHDSAASFSIFTTPILVTLCLQFLPWRRLFLIIGTIALLLPVFFWKVSTEPAHETSQPGSWHLDSFRKKSIRALAFVWIFASACAMGVYSILPLFLIKERGIDFNYANTLIGISRAGGVFVSILFGFVVDRYGYRKVLRLGILLTGLSTMCLSLASDLNTTIIALILQATLSLVFFPAGLSALSNLTSPQERSVVAGIVLSFGVVLGTGVVPFLLGVIADHSSFGLGILGLGILTTLSIVATKNLRNE